jgi:membrane protein implicated in regulation of membrane protease activity
MTLLLGALAAPLPAFAYVGPGAGLSLIGAFWALILALFTAVFFLLAWPVRRMLRQRGRSNRAERSQTERSDDSGGDGSPAA